MYGSIYWLIDNRNYSRYYQNIDFYYIPLKYDQALINWQSMDFKIDYSQEMLDCSSSVQVYLIFFEIKIWFNW